MTEENSQRQVGKDRKIIHIDMDCFYAAIECRDDLNIAEKPVGVGGESGRGVLTTCNYHARKFGCRSAMPVFKARELCPQLILKPPRFEVYRKESQKIRRIFGEYTKKIEPLSLDEAYLDVSHRSEYAWNIARQIRKRIWEETSLTASAGISSNKMLAKIASDWNKPNGQYVILPKDIGTFMEVLPVRRIPGVGKKTEALLNEKGISSCGELQEMEKIKLIEWLGSAQGAELWERCRGIDPREVNPDRVRKSMSVERTFERNLETKESCLPYLKQLQQELDGDLRKQKDQPSYNKVFVKLKFANFQTTTKEGLAKDLEEPFIRALFEEAFDRSPHPVRLMGLGVRFVTAEKDKSQLELEF